MKNLMFLIAVLLLLAISCKNSNSFSEFNEEKERSTILKMSENVTQALLNKDIDKLMELVNNQSIDTSITVVRGEIFKIPSKLSKDEVLRYSGLGSGMYLELNYLDRPIIRFSKDGSLAWEIGKMKMVFESIDSTGKADTSNSVYTYLQLYEKKAGKWLYGDIANTFDK